MKKLFFPKNFSDCAKNDKKTLTDAAANTRSIFILITFLDFHLFSIFSSALNSPEISAAAFFKNCEQVLWKDF